ncbi:HYC_CC_PP family protein [Dyadobacter luticola]|uniref:Uncharacterized protein n=1 Tax=Dyadobacter luticola TaxID=1979387 RepID=A0A5R9KRB9_9BACT|nr:hypothetical protein [Dyadobacter luticola]TLU98835.1 hypothetical protein FEN17_19765 [Dyadobacter luticola]
MENRFHQLITVSMALLVLLSSTGFAFIEHECMFRGKSVQFAQESKEASGTKKMSSCCAKARELKESKGTFFKKTACCKENQKFEKLEVVSSGAHFNAAFIKVFADLIPWSVKSYQFINAEWILPSARSLSPGISFSSRFHGKGMRCFIQSYLI